MTGVPVAQQTIWIIGDTFAAESMPRTLMTFTEENSFIHANYDVKAQLSNHFKSGIRSTLARLRNNMAKAINEFVILPKMVVVVIEDDLIKDFKNCPENQLEKMYERSCKWLMNEFRKMLMTHNDNLPKKGRRNTHVLWIIPTDHAEYRSKNRLKRQLFGSCMVRQAKMQSRMRALQLKQIWDENNRDFYIKEARRYTADGLVAFWQAIDRTVRFYDFIVSKNEEKFNINDQPRLEERQHKNDGEKALHQYETSENKFNFNPQRREGDLRFRLPPPSKKRF